MDQLITIYSNLIIAFLGFVVPLLSALIAIFRGGAEKLKVIYETQLSNQKNKILESETGKDNSTGNVENLHKGLRLLVQDKRRLEKRINRLRPQRQIIIIVIPLVISFLFICAYFPILEVWSDKKYWIGGVSLGLSLGAFIVGIRSSWHLIDVIIEVQKFIEDDGKEIDNKKISLMEAMLDKISNPAGENIHILLDGKKIEDSCEIQVSSNFDNKIGLGINNGENLMLKNIEYGMEIPKDVVEIKNVASGNMSEVDGLYVMCYCVASIHSKKESTLETVCLNFNKVGVFEVTTFIKAENIDKPIYRKLKVKVVDSSKTTIWAN